jgi:hypothetical protein
MPNYTIDRERFLELLDQFKGDIPYLQKIFNRLKTLMPEEYFKQLTADLYHQFVYDQDYYVAEHHIYSDDKHYFRSFDELYEFLKDRHLEKEYPLRKNKIELAMNTPFQISGYKIAFVKKDKL